MGGLLGSLLDLTLRRSAVEGRPMLPPSHPVSDVAERFTGVWQRLLSPPDPQGVTVNNDECPR